MERMIFREILALGNPLYQQEFY